MNIVNLTPHAITVQGTDGEKTTFQPSGTLARVSQTQQSAGKIGAFELRRNTFGDVEGIPAPAADTFYIVSAIVLSASDRPDLIAPDTGPSAIRNDKGQIEAVRAFIIK